MGKTKKRYEIDGANFRSLDGFYREISRSVIPGAEWGNNLDAFNDILRGGFGTPEEGFVLVWKNSALSRQRLGFRETAIQLALRLTSCHPTNRADVMKQLSEAWKREGPTVFDWLIEIIREHGDGGAEAEDGVELILE